MNYGIRFVGMCLTLETVGVPEVTLYGPPNIVSSLHLLTYGHYGVHYTRFE